jgi:hypothetical protein
MRHLDPCPREGEEGGEEENSKRENPSRLLMDPPPDCRLAYVDIGQASYDIHDML